MGTHVGLIEKDSAEVLTIREYFILSRQVGPPRVHQVYTWQSVLLSNGLSAQVFLNRQRVITATLHRRVVADDHALHAFDATDAGNHTCGWNIFSIHLVCSQLAHFQER
ncbi:hypothetical protein D3C76_1220770 [compost metagenome]